MTQLLPSAPHEQVFVGTFEGIPTSAIGPPTLPNTQGGINAPFMPANAAWDAKEDLRLLEVVDQYQNPTARGRLD
jgi:hypothetical protein